MLADLAREMVPGGGTAQPPRQGVPAEIQVRPASLQADPQILPLLARCVRENQMGQFARAEATARAILDGAPQEAEGWVGLGMALGGLGDRSGSLAAFQKAVECDPSLANARYNFAVALFQIGRFGEAEREAEAAIALRSEIPEPHQLLSDVLEQEGRLVDAAAAIAKAVTLRPKDPDILNRMGSALLKLNKLGEAAAAYRTALGVRGNFAEAHFNLGRTLRLSGKVEEAAESFHRALRAGPDWANYAQALSELMYCRQILCDWTHLESNERKWRQADRQAKAEASPFEVTVRKSSLSEQQRHARAFVRSNTHRVAPFPPRLVARHRKIRLGYLSADFQMHATSILVAELFEQHDRGRFSVTAYSYGSNDNSEMRARLVRAFDSFVDLRDASHQDAARRIRDDSIDILIDLKGHTKDARMQITAFRPAPIQVNYLGFPGTMGAPFIDYIIADPFVAPMEHQAFFDERIVHLPDSYQPNDSKRQIATRASSRYEHHLPEDAFVFCSFNRPYKITPEIFDIWARLLKDSPGAVLWLLQGGETVSDNLRREAAARGISPERLVFAPHMALSEHLERHRHADLFLDTLPCNAHTTASDALWAGLPLLTCAGETFAGRVAGSLLRAVGLPELITLDLPAYEALALDLARSPVRLQGLRQRLTANPRALPLFDSVRYTRHLEAAFTQMYDIWAGGKPPEAFAVDA